MRRPCRITGWGTWLPEDSVTFRGGTRYRIAPEVSHLDMLVHAARAAIGRAGLGPDDLDCVIAAVAAGIQPIPCTAALVMEQVAPDAPAAAFDVNSTCTSFITALEVASRYLADGTYRRILIVSGDVGSRFLNPEQPESFELFSDAGAAVVLETAEAPSPAAGVLCSRQRTWPRHAHDTELRGGLSRFPARDYADTDPRDHLFDMKGREAMIGMLKVLPGFFGEFFTESGLGIEDVDLFVPHQASAALRLAMHRIGIPEEKYVDRVAEYGNMVSSSVPYTLATVLDEGRVGPGDTVVLCGTAAGLTVNALALRL
ncbi:3-oxoacyl-[acyl-carrier-protein] synthase III C-terminal domain-containing protein [Brevibacterium litoralis]|uniref:3-oxoacyl-[acyl-carrier-protein] synthase III C-terminal domain-containing protein n=1 Tax=Brevibacterium litoralis TaxID=3138935 RepID=UPI0032EC104A